MRYLLFFFFLFLHSQFVFSQGSGDSQPSSGGGSAGSSPPPEPTCSSTGVTQWVSPVGLSLTSNQCAASNGYQFVLGFADPNSQVRCDHNCTCPAPTVFNVTVDANGVSSSGCIDPADETPPDDLCPSGYPKVDGQCPVCIGEQNEDGTCADDDSGSSAASDANTSSPTSSPDSGSAASAGGGGDDDGGDDNGGGGGGGDNGGNNNSGGGSASSAASSSPSGINNSTGSGSSSGAVSSSAGQCDPTAKNYLSCISSQKITPQEGDIPWVPNSGYGNWIPVSEDSPCPNKYRDASGEWWCSGGVTGGANGSATSGGASGSARSAAGKCDSTSEDYLRCISGQLSSSGSQTSASSANSSAARSSSGSGAFSSLGEKGEFDGEASEKKMDDLKEELDKKIADIKADIQGEFGGTISGSGSIQDFCKNIRNTEVCFGLEKWEPFLDPISAAIFLVACVMAFSIVLRG